MAPRVTVFSLNGHGPDAEFIAPNVSAGDLVGAPMFPSAAYFERPADLEPGQKMMPRLNPEHPLFAQAFGYVAPKGQCILDLDPNECWVVPPSPTGYEFAHQGVTVLMDGTELKTANIGGGAGHAGGDLGWRQVPLYYENTSYQLAAVRYGEDHYGVWAAGVLVPDTTWGQALTMVRSATSGDWRWVDELGAWDFMGSCLVNLPGLPLYDGTKVAMKASASVLNPERAMLVTFSGAPMERADDMTARNTVTASGAPACSCNKSHTADPETAPEPTFGADQVSEMIASALEQNNAAWETKLAETVAPLRADLDAAKNILIDSL